MLAALLLAAPQVARAQPDPNNAPKATNPDNRPVRPDNRREPMTPEQREALMERYMRAQLERAGLIDQKQQDAALEYIQDELDAREDLQEESRALATAMRNTTLTDPQVAGLLNSYLVAVEDDRARRAKAQQKLSESLDVTKVPRLEAMLTLLGLWGDAPNLGGNFMGRGRNRDAGRDRDQQREQKPEKPQAKEKKPKANA